MGMNYEQFTIKAQEALQNATVIAQQEDHGEIGTEHVLLALLQQKDGLIPPLIERIGVSLQSVVTQAESLVKSNPRIHGNIQLSLSSQMSRVLAKADKEAAMLKDEYLSVEHIFLALVSNDDKTARMLQENGITREAVLAAFKKVTA